MSLIRTIWTSKSQGDPDTYVGRAGEIWYDPTVGQLLLSDGSTVGGVAIGGGGSGGSNYILPTASASVKGGVKIGSNIAITDGVISVAAPFSGSYNDLTNKPTIPSLTGYATETFVTTRGYLTSVGTISYNDLSNKPTLFSGSYTDLTNKPTIPTTVTVNGTSITLGSSGTVTAAADTLTGTELKSTVVTSSLTSVGTLGSLTVQSGSGINYVARFKGSTGGDQFAIGVSSTAGYGAGNDVLNSAGTAYAPYTISASTMTFKTGSSLPTTAFSIDLFGNVTFNNTVTGSVSGNAGTATSAATLTTARNINGVAFDGSAAINIPTLTDGTNSIKITAVPSALTGATGDVVGSVAFDSTYIYYCFQAFTGTSYSLPILSSGGLIQVTVNAGNSQTRIAIVAAFAATPAGWSYGGAPVTNITGSNQTIVITMSSGYSGLGNGISYTLIQPPASANWKTTPWGAITSAAAGSLTGNTLASGVTASSLTSFGATPAMVSPAITNSLTTPSTIFDLINTTATTVNFAGVATTLSVGASTGTTTINNNLSMASGKTIGTTATVTSNHTTAFSAGDSAISNVALSVPRNAAIRDRTNGSSVMYFDVSNGGSTNGEFQFRSSNAFTNVLTMNTGAFNVNPDAVVTARTPSLARTAFNAAMGTELTVDDFRFRITNSGLAGIFPQIISNASYSKNCAWTVVAARSGSAVTQTGSTGIIVANNAWTSLYTSGGMDSAGDTYTATLQDKALGRIYRVTFMRSDNGATDGFNIIAERLL